MTYNSFISDILYHIKEFIKFLLNPDIHNEILEELGPL